MLIINTRKLSRSRPRRISSLLKELADNNYIIMEYKHKFQRKIYINEEKFTSDLPEDFF